MEIINVTLNPNDKGADVALSDNNLVATNNSQRLSSVRATHGKTIGKWYWEITILESNSSTAIGISTKSFSISSDTVTSNNQRSYFVNGSIFPGNIKYGSKLAKGDVIGVALDLEDKTLEFYQNGVSLGVSHSNLEVFNEVFPTAIFNSYSTTGTPSNRALKFNFGAAPFMFSIPKGYYSFDGRKNSFINNIVFSSEGKIYSCESNDKDCIPIMSSNNAPSGRAFGNASTAWHAFNKAETPRYTTPSGSGGEGYVGYEFEEPICISKYSVNVAINNSLNAQFPKAWTFEGSNDDKNWNILDDQIDQFWVGNLTREYVFLNNSKYLMYRINFRENHGSSINTVISNLAMYEPDVLITIDSYSEYSLIKYGYNDPFTLNHFNQNKNIIFENVSLGLGKKFEHSVNLSKRRLKHIKLI